MSFNFDFGVFPAGPPQSVSEIYPLLGFEPSLEYDPKKTILILACRVHTAGVLKNPSVGFCSLQHIQPADYVGTGYGSPVMNGSGVCLPPWRSSSHPAS